MNEATITNGWNSCELGDVITLQRGHDLPQRRRREGSIPIVSSSGTTGFHNEFKAKGPGVVTGRYGTLGEVFFVADDYWPLNTTLYVRDFKGNDPQFVAYFLRTMNLERYNGAGAVPGLNRNHLHKLPIHFPTDTDIQIRIAVQLSRFDDLIENNRRRIGLLEEAAQQLYKEWFVRLRFPGHEINKIINGVPEGWRSVSLGDITTKIGSGATPRGGKAAYQESGITLIRSLNVYDDHFDDDGLAFINDDQAARLANVVVESNDILLNITGASVARCCMAPKRLLPARVNQHVMIIRIDPILADPHYVLRAINSYERKQTLLNYAGAGATREALTKDTVTNFTITLPDESLLKQFAGIVGNITRQSALLSHQNIKLTEARDLLLPRLVSGEIEV